MSPDDTIQKKIQNYVILAKSGIQELYGRVWILSRPIKIQRAMQINCDAKDKHHVVSITYIVYSSSKEEY